MHTLSQIEERLSSSELKRAKAREEIREKQKKRDEHAKKVKVNYTSILSENVPFINVQARRGSTSDSVGVDSISSTLEADSLYNADTNGENLYT